jgi:hypothetical protein
MARKAAQGTGKGQSRSRAKPKPEAGEPTALTKKTRTPGKSKTAEPKKLKAGEPARAALQVYKNHDPADQQIADAAWTAHVRVLQQSNDRKDLIVAGEARKLVVGIPLPALCLKYLIQSSVLPCGRLYQITGLEGSCKSSFLAELMRWGMIHAGYSAVYEVEAKDIAELREAIWEYNELWLNVRGLIEPCNSLNDWMRKLHSEVSELKKINDGFGQTPGVGWRNPYILGVDAFTSASSDEMLTKLNKEGSPGRSHPVDANFIAQYGRSLPEKLRGTSIIIAGTNHLKPKRDDNGNEISHSPGGRSIKFMESVEFEMERQGKFKQAKRSGVWLRIETMKNSLGERLKSIRVSLIWDWRWNDARQDWLQHAAFDWHSATVDMLTLFENDKDSKATWNAIQDVVGIEKTNTGRFWSARLGIPKDSPVSRHDFGRAIDYDLDVQTQLYPILGITRRSAFRPGVPLEETIRLASSEADARLPNLYEAYDNNLNEFEELTENLHRIKTRPPKDAPDEDD